MQNFRKLLVWSKSHSLALEVNELAKHIPRRDNSDLINQLRRAALSVPANIAEGSSRETDKDFARFLQIALASASELEYHLQYAVDADLIPRVDFDARQAEVIEVRKMLVGLIRRAKGIPKVQAV